MKKIRSEKEVASRIREEEMRQADQSWDVHSRRPTLTRSLSCAEFNSWYWLKRELVVFCREQAISTAGAKSDLMKSISCLLAGKEPEKPPAPNVSVSMPETLGLDTVVTPGFKLSRKLREFFFLHEGEGFHFNQCLRDFFNEPNGRTLGDALNLYRSTKDLKNPQIASQFEYNRHIRQFFESHPGGTMKEAIASWWKMRGKPRP